MKTYLTSMKSMKPHLTTLHNGGKACAVAQPVGGMKPLFALPVRSSAFSLQPLAFPMKPVLALLMRLVWAAALVLPAFGAQAGVVFTTLHSFQVFPNGVNPYAVLVQASDGSFYGTTSGGGQGGAGTVFRLTVVRAAPVFLSVTLINSVLNMTWSTEPGGAYLVQYNSDLNPTNWTELGHPVTAAGATLSFADLAVTDPNFPHRSYRVVLLP
jgi:uncharacterized repeat protein (TIGR03803 family)